MARPYKIDEYASLCNQKCTHFHRKFDAQIRDEMMLLCHHQFHYDYELPRDTERKKVIKIG